ncbi:amidase [Kaistia algarum]|uniref:amidase n=1 Tax=Kaistia algarum TaxID=2083279 RepID=UPI000CE8E034|nr:amidase [Kaistia algarum]MCX5516559.1 amidase [Kaistia algarum]PPE77498.1 amidase [Kaistia algarum]
MQAGFAAQASAFDVTEASIAKIGAALDEGRVTSVELVVHYLNRIAFYDRRGLRLNAVPVLNPQALNEAAEADRLRAAGTVLGPLHGIPFTVKDSYKVKGLTVAAGSPAFAELIANEDAAAVAALRKAGAICLGKTNMPPMAIGGLQRGVYGRAESPYNPDYLAAAWHSGSSSGSGVAVASSLCAFGLGEETVSSGRSPASNNGLVAYTPSRGLLSIRGNWPLFALRDTVVPHTRSVEDMLALLDAILVPDEQTAGDLWRAQTTIPLPSVESIRPADFEALAKPGALAGLTIGVPRMYVGTDTEADEPIEVRPSILSLWREAALVLDGLGARLVEVDYPAVSNYEKDRPGTRSLVDRGWMPDYWNAIEIGDMVAASWEEFLHLNGDPNYPTLGEIRPEVIHADPPEAFDTRRRKSAHPGRDEFNYPAIVERARAGIASPLETFAELPGVMRGLEAARKEWFEDWMAENGLDLVVFPANADIGTANADVDPAASDLTWKNGTVFSNMNHVMRHLGIPSVSVTMGVMADTGIPVNLTFAGRAYADMVLLRAAYDYEQASRLRVAPPTTPSLPEAPFAPAPVRAEGGGDLDVALTGEARLQRSGEVHIMLQAKVSGTGSADLLLYLDGRPVEHENGRAEIRIPAAERQRPNLYASLAVALAADASGRKAGAFAILDYRP